MIDMERVANDELLRAWDDVPHGAIVQVRREGDSRGQGTGPRYGYRYIDAGRWIYSHGSWDPGVAHFPWAAVGRQVVEEFVIVARDVSPHSPIGNLYSFDLPMTADLSSVCTFPVGSQVKWNDAETRTLVMDEHKSVAWRHADGKGWWIRHATAWWHELDAADHGLWTWSGTRTSACTVVATDVVARATASETNAYLRDLIGGLEKTTW